MASVQTPRTPRALSKPEVPELRERTVMEHTAAEAAIHATIVSSFREEGDIKYIICVQHGSRERTVARVYRDFVKLDEALATAVPHISRTTLPEDSYFGIRAYWNIGGFNEQRLKGLQKYLSHLLSELSELSEALPMAAFLEDPVFGLAQPCEGHGQIVLRRALDHQQVVATVPNGDILIYLAREGENVKVRWKDIEGWAKAVNVKQRPKSPIDSFNDTDSFERQASSSIRRQVSGGSAVSQVSSSLWASITQPPPGTPTGSFRVSDADSFRRQQQAKQAGTSRHGSFQRQLSPGFQRQLSAGSTVGDIFQRQLTGSSVLSQVDSSPWAHQAYSFIASPPDVVWAVALDDGTWAPHTTNTSKHIESDFVAGSEVTSIVVGRNQCQHTIHFERMQQISVDTAEVRAIKRGVVPSSFGGSTEGSTPQDDAVWATIGDEGAWMPYSSATSKRLEDAFAAGNQSTCISSGTHRTQYKIDFEQMEQTNTTTGKVLSIQRGDAPVLRTKNSPTNHSDLATFLPMLQSAQVALLAPDFLIELSSDGKSLSRRQDILPEAFVNVSEMTEDVIRNMIIISISYPWLSKTHPDPERYHLVLLAASLELFRNGSFESATGCYYDQMGNTTATKGSLKKAGWCFGQGDASSAGVFLDFASLFQKPRSRTEAQLFASALLNMHIWYAHQQTLVWMFTATPDFVPNGYDARGWTTFERSISEMNSASHLLLVFNRNVREALLQEQSPYQHGDYSKLAFDAMSPTRAPPLSPEAFNELIDSKIFGNSQDCEVIVKPRYARAFTEVIAGAKTLKFNGLKWRDTEADKLMNVVRCHCKHLQYLDLSWNRLTRSLEVWVSSVRQHLKGINLSGNQKIVGDIRCFSKYVQLSVLDLQLTGVSGDLAYLSKLTGLTKLGLSSTSISGQIGSLATLERLTTLGLSDTRIIGDISSLSNLEEIADLRLGKTKVHGDISILAKFFDMTNLDLNKTSITGNITGLAKLLHMKVLQLSETSVMGDIALLSCLGNLQELRLSRTKVAGDISSLASLVQIKRLHLGDTNVTGRISILSKFDNMIELVLTRTGVEGDICDLGSLPQIKRLSLESTNVTGSACSISSLTKMEFLHLRRTNLSGGISCFAALLQMRRLHLSDTIVTGDISSLSCLVKLEELQLARTSLQGNISSFTRLENIVELDITRTAIAGDISSLVGLVQMKRLSLDGTSVTGDASCLSSLPRIEDLLLSRTAVAGDISGFAGLVDLKTLSLTDTKIAGDISGLSGLVKMYDLRAQNTSIAGEISALANAVQMKTLCLSDTSVTGDITGLSSLAKIEELWLHKTGVAGDIRGLARLAQLKKLDLGATKVTGDISCLSGLFKIEGLQLSGTNVMGTISSLAGLVRMKKLLVNGTRVTGDPSSLSCLRLSVLKVDKQRTTSRDCEIILD